jgi:hypothetical protein
LYLDIVFNKWRCSVTYKQWCNLRELLTTLSDEVDSKICDVKVSEAFDDVWDMVDEIDTTQEIT